MKRDQRNIVISEIHRAPQQGVFYVTGGGSLFISDLLTVSGASNTVLEAQVPYATDALTDLIGHSDTGACSDRTARTMAVTAYLRASALLASSARDDVEVFGFAITASLASLTGKRGPHRAHIAMQTRTTTYTWFIELRTGARTRDAEERVVADAAVHMLAESLGHQGGHRQITTRDTIETASTDIVALFEEPGSVFGTPGNAFLPGSFDPLHDGHMQMRTDASRRIGQPVQFELCVHNVDKPPLDFIELARRRKQFADPDIVLTNVPTFVEKANLLGQGNGITFVVGTDTIKRIGETRYYLDEEARDAALNELENLGTKFLVYGRLDDQGFETLNDLSLPDSLNRISEGVSEQDFRVDVSSTEMRIDAPISSSRKAP